VDVFGEIFFLFNGSVLLPSDISPGSFESDTDLVTVEEDGIGDG
jgi:hypothetical protein